MEQYNEYTIYPVLDASSLLDFAMQRCSNQEIDLTASKFHLERQMKKMFSTIRYINSSRRLNYSISVLEQGQSAALIISESLSAEIQDYILNANRDISNLMKDRYSSVEYGFSCHETHKELKANNIVDATLTNFAACDDLKGLSLEWLDHEVGITHIGEHIVAVDATGMHQLLGVHLKELNDGSFVDSRLNTNEGVATLSVPIFNNLFFVESAQNFARDIVDENFHRKEVDIENVVSAFSRFCGIGKWFML